jgi:hypothetical protein
MLKFTRKNVVLPDVVTIDNLTGDSQKDHQVGIWRSNNKKNEKVRLAIACTQGSLFPSLICSEGHS